MGEIGFNKRRSKIHGFGVFATTPIPKNKRIVDYAGELISPREGTRRENRYWKKGQTWIFEMSRRWNIDGNVGGNLSRFINHSKKPNCWWEILARKKIVWVRAGRNIKPGEELTIDYGDDFPGMDGGYEG